MRIAIHRRYRASKRCTIDAANVTDKFEHQRWQLVPAPMRGTVAQCNDKPRPVLLSQASGAHGTALARGAHGPATAIDHVSDGAAAVELAREGLDEVGGARAVGRHYAVVHLFRTPKAASGEEWRVKQASPAPDQRRVPGCPRSGGPNATCRVCRSGRSHRVPIELVSTWLRAATNEKKYE